MKPTIDGVLFIIPNNLTVRTPHDPEYCWEKTSKLWGNTQGQPHVQIWCADQGCENWQAHKQENPKKKGFVKLVPVSVFEGKQEGDTVEINGLVLKLEQTKYRYRNFGRFEEVLTGLLEKNKKDPDYIWGEAQAAWIKENFVA
jgi:hypothetical protein